MLSDFFDDLLIGKLEIAKIAMSVMIAEGIDRKRCAGLLDTFPAQRFRAKSDDVRVLRSSKSPELTLITCYPFHVIRPAPKRFVVHAAMAKEYALK
jgi:sortase (surface protein transpeptidase)